MGRVKLTEEEKLKRQEQKEQQQLKKAEELKQYKEQLKEFVDSLDLELIEKYFRTSKLYEDGLTQKEIFELLLIKFSEQDFKFEKITTYK